jgi:hypothetical protein
VPAASPLYSALQVPVSVPVSDTHRDGIREEFRFQFLAIACSCFEEQRHWQEPLAHIELCSFHGACVSACEFKQSSGTRKCTAVW